MTAGHLPIPTPSFELVPAENDRLSSDDPLFWFHLKIQIAMEFGDNRATEQDSAEAVALFDMVAIMDPDFEPTCPVRRDKAHLHFAVIRLECDDRLNRSGPSAKVGLILRFTAIAIDCQALFGDALHHALDRRAHNMD